MSVIWLKLWQHVWQSLKLLVKVFGFSPTDSLAAEQRRSA